MPRSSADVFSARSAIMSATMTVAPASPRARQHAAPIPCPPPVTTATRSFSFSFSRYISLPRSQCTAFAVEPMHVFRLRRQPDLVADLEAKLARRAHRQPPDAVDHDVEEGV